MLRLDVAKRQGELIERAAVATAIHDRAQAERDAHLAWVARIAARIASELDTDLPQLAAALDREMRTHLVELAETPLEELLIYV